jgi:formate/nitrite transporter FocA (FNT family)
MYVAVTGFAKTSKYLFLIMPVAFFILAGFNHCVADMFYSALGTQ